MVLEDNKENEKKKKKKKRLNVRHNIKTKECKEHKTIRERENIKLQRNVYT